MARPQKQTVDYFPHDTDASVVSRTLKILENRFGNNGYAFWYKLLELLGRRDGHFIEFDGEDGLEYLASETKIKDVETLKEMLEILVRRGSIDKELYEHKIIWCQSFVDRVAEAYRKRTISLPQKPNLNNANNSVSVGDNPITDGDNPQMKLDKTILDKKDNKGEKQKHGEFQNVLLTDEEYQKLVNKLGEPTTKDFVERLSAYMKSKKKRYSDHYATILNWSRRDDGKTGKTERKRLPDRGSYTQGPDYSDV